ncbi:MAG: hypothetical protein ACK4M7_01540, partial [Burkholderiales bacterium]
VEITEFTFKLLKFMASKTVEITLLSQKMQIRYLELIVYLAVNYRGTQQGVAYANLLSNIFNTQSAKFNYKIVDEVKQMIIANNMLSLHKTYLLGDETGNK